MIQPGDSIRIQSTSNGFIITSEGKEYLYLWEQVTEIIAYKQDLLTTDEICLDIVLPGFMFTLTESDAEWDVLTKSMEETFPSIDADWFSKVMLPAFATNAMTIYKKVS
jgi:hypothetical protein